MKRIIYTERLVLRPLNESDAQDVCEWVGDPVVNRFMPYSVYQNADQVKKWLGQLKDENNVFGFALKSTGKVIGSGSVTYSFEENTYRLGYNLNRAFWNQGYATEAAKAIIGWAYENLGAREFMARHANANPASGKVLLKCGFAFERYGQYSRYDNSETFEATYYKLHLD